MFEYLVYSIGGYAVMIVVAFAIFKKSKRMP